MRVRPAANTALVVAATAAATAATAATTAATTTAATAATAFYIALNTEFGSPSRQIISNMHLMFNSSNTDEPII